MFGEEILSQIDATIDQLIQNAETVRRADLTDLSENEIESFQKTQESLLHRLMNLDQILETKQKSIRIQNKRSVTYKIQEKMSRFEKLNDEVSKTISRSSKKMPILTKRRGKRFLRSC